MNHLRRAGLAALTLTTLALPAAALAEEQARPTIDVAFVLDTTGSMGELLEGAKQKIWSIASRIAAGQPTPKLRVALVAYRDVGDEYVTRRYDLTGDLDAVFGHLRRFQADGGGDTPEHVGRGLGEAVSMLSWSQDPRTMKMIFVVGDAPPQSYQDQWGWRTWAQRAAKKGIVVNTIRCGNLEETEKPFREIARATDGTFVTIDAGGGMLAVTTPYDKDLARINAEIATKSVYAGSRDARRAAKERSASLAAMPAPAAADRLGYLATVGRGSGGGMALAAPAAPAGTVDLAEKPADAAKLSDDELPDELRGLDAKARGEKLARTAAERKALEAQAVELARKRETWITSHAPAKKDSFDETVMRSVKAKAAEHGIAY